MNSVFADFKYFFKSHRFFSADKIQHIITAAFHGVVVTDNGVHGLVLTIVNALHYFFKRFH